VPFFVPLEKIFLFFKDKVVHSSTTLWQIFKKINIYEILREYCTSKNIPTSLKFAWNYYY